MCLRAQKQTGSEQQSTGGLRGQEHAPHATPDLQR
jgi:hypothetical protein